MQDETSEYSRGKRGNASDSALDGHLIGVPARFAPKMQLDSNTTSWRPHHVASNNNRTDQLFQELQQLIEHSGASTPVPEHELHNFPSVGYFSSGKMPPKKSGRAALREEGMAHMRPFFGLQPLTDGWTGLERTDNDLAATSWPQVQMINQKNYYTCVQHRRRMHDIAS
jgi:hypothetical protein